MNYESRPEEGYSPIELGIDQRFVDEILVELRKGDFKAFTLETSSEDMGGYPSIMRFIVRTPTNAITTMEFLNGLDEDEHVRIAEDLDRQQFLLLQNDFEGGRVFGDHEEIMLQMAEYEAKDNYYRILGGIVAVQGEHPLIHDFYIFYPELYREFVERYVDEFVPSQATQGLESLDEAESEDTVLSASVCLSLLFLDTFYDPNQKINLDLE